MTLSHPQLHIYICDYTEGRLSDEIRPLFEAFLAQHPDVSTFVDKAVKGRELLHRFGTRLRTQEGA
jgi:hypothetical protein